MLYILIATKFGATLCLNPKEYDRPIDKILIEQTDGGVDYSFECIGNVDTMVSLCNSTKTRVYMCIYM